MTRLLLSAVLLATLVACGDDEEKLSTFSCDLDADDICLAYRGEAAMIEYVAGTAGACELQGGTAGTGCPATDRVGRCANVQAGIELVQHYYSPTYVAATVESSCIASGGTFTAN